MPDALAGLPAAWLIGGGLALGVAALLLHAGRQMRVSGVPLPMLAVALALGVGGALWLAAPLLTAYVASTRPMPMTCDEARALGYSTARRGEAGYFPHLDADGDGVACEAMPQR